MIEDINKGPLPAERLILEWRNNPVQAAKDIFNVDLDQHQRIVLRNRWTHSNEIDILSRGTGKTFLNAITAGLRAVLWSGKRIGLIGPSFRQSKMMFSELERLYERSPIFQQALDGGKGTGISKGPESWSMKFCSTPGRIGSFIEAIPLGDGTKIRGARYYEVFADETAQIDENILNTVVLGFMATSENPMERVNFMRDQREKIARGEMRECDMVMPEDNRIYYTSTAYYQYNHLWPRAKRMMSDILDEMRRRERTGESLDGYQALGQPLNGGQIPFRVLTNKTDCLTAFTYTDPSEAFMNMKSIEKAKREMSDYEFRMEYMAFFPPDSEGFFRRSTLDAARSHNQFSCQLTPRRGMIYVMGVDPARDGDNFAVCIAEVDVATRKINIVRVQTWNKKEFPHMHEVVRDLIHTYQIRLIKMDAGGGGTTIRDLLANQQMCPPGQKLILEQEFDEHRVKIGERILAPLVQFSSGQWVHDANHNLLSGLQHGAVRIASIHPVSGEIWTEAKEEADKEMEETLLEMSSIVKGVSGSREHWDTPTSTQRKDRYSAVLMASDAAFTILNSHNNPGTLAMGFWG